jgi:hypothetical protein
MYSFHKGKQKKPQTSKHYIVYLYAMTYSSEHMLQHEGFTLDYPFKLVEG